MYCVVLFHTFPSSEPFHIRITTLSGEEMDIFLNNTLNQMPITHGDEHVRFGQMDLVFRGPASSTAGRRQWQERLVPVSQHLNKNIVVSRPSLPTILTFFVSTFCCF